MTWFRLSQASKNGIDGACSALRTAKGTQGNIRYANLGSEFSTYVGTLKSAVDGVKGSSVAWADLATTIATFTKEGSSTPTVFTLPTGTKANLVCYFDSDDDDNVWLISGANPITTTSSAGALHFTGNTQWWVWTSENGGKTWTVLINGQNQNELISNQQSSFLGKTFVATDVTEYVLMGTYPPISTSGTWQIQDTAPMGYGWWSVDDDNYGITSWYTELATVPDFPVVWNIEAENLNKVDNDTNHTILKDCIKTLKASLGNRFEVCQHGASSHVMCDTNQYTAEDWSTLYSTYTTGGGTKTLEEFKTAFKAEVYSYDFAQGATYLTTSRKAIESAIGFPVDCIAAWGSSGNVTVDDIAVVSKSLLPNPINSTEYATFLRGLNYKIGTKLDMLPSVRNYSIQRSNTGTLSGYMANIDNAASTCGVVDMFSHGINGQYMSMTDLKSLIAYGKSKSGFTWVTPSQYFAKGAFVDNAHLVVSVDCTVPSLTVGDIYTAPSIVATFADGHTATVNGTVSGTVDTTTAGTYTINLFYHGVKNTKSVTVAPSMSYPTADYTYNGIIQNTDAQHMLYISNEVDFEFGTTLSGTVHTVVNGAGKISIWYTADAGTTWTKVVDKQNHYANYQIAREGKTGSNGYYDATNASYFNAGVSTSTKL